MRTVASGTRVTLGLVALTLLAPAPAAAECSADYQACVLSYFSEPLADTPEKHKMMCLAETSDCLAEAIIQA